MPNQDKMDKATFLMSAVEYISQLQVRTHLLRTQCCATCGTETAPNSHECKLPRASCMCGRTRLYCTLHHLQMCVHA